MLVSARYKINYPDPVTRGDTPDVPRDIKSVVDGVEKSAMYGQGTLASRPVSSSGTPGIQGRFYMSTDQTPMVLSYDMGTGWIDIGVAKPSFIPGETRLWPGSALPASSSWGHWAWADGGIFDSTVYPQAAANIATAWRTAFGAVDPGAGKFRVPDLRGVTPTGMDAMPGGTRANRVTRAAAANLAAMTGEETHQLVLAELAAHGHSITDPGHKHDVRKSGNANEGPGTSVFIMKDGSTENVNVPGGGSAEGSSPTGIAIQQSGGNGAHENMQPSIFVPYICKLDD